MITMFTMLRENDMNAYFYVQDHSLYLITDKSFYSPPSLVIDVIDQTVCTSDLPYQFAPLYEAMPSDVGSITASFLG